MSERTLRSAGKLSKILATVTSDTDPHGLSRGELPGQTRRSDAEQAVPSRKRKLHPLAPATDRSALIAPRQLFPIHRVPLESNRIELSDGAGKLFAPRVSSYGGTTVPTPTPEPSAPAAGFPTGETVFAGPMSLPHPIRNYGDGVGDFGSKRGSDWPDDEADLAVALGKRGLNLINFAKDLSYYLRINRCPTLSDVLKSFEGRMADHDEIKKFLATKASSIKPDALIAALEGARHYLLRTAIRASPSERLRIDIKYIEEQNLEGWVPNLRKPYLQQHDVTLCLELFIQWRSGQGPNLAIEGIAEGLSNEFNHYQFADTLPHDHFLRGHVEDAFSMLCGYSLLSLGTAQDDQIYIKKLIKSKRFANHTYKSVALTRNLLQRVAGTLVTETLSQTLLALPLDESSDPVRMLAHETGMRVIQVLGLARHAQDAAAELGRDLGSVPPGPATLDTTRTPLAPFVAPRQEPLSAPSLAPTSHVEHGGPTE